MLDHAIKTRGIWAPIIQPRETAPAATPQREEPEELTVTNPRWEHVEGDDNAESVMDGDNVTLMVDVSGAADGSIVTFKVFDPTFIPPSRVAVVRGEVEGGVGTANWEVKVKRDRPKLEFEGAVRRVSSERAEIPVMAGFAFSI